MRELAAEATECHAPLTVAHCVLLSVLLLKHAGQLLQFEAILEVCAVICMTNSAASQRPYTSMLGYVGLTADSRAIYVCCRRLVQCHHHGMAANYSAHLAPHSRNQQDSTERNQPMADRE